VPRDGEIAPVEPDVDLDGGGAEGARDAGHAVLGCVTAGGLVRDNNRTRSAAIIRARFGRPVRPVWQVLPV
jgi:hypothetical protein